ncbi:hypothetical protein L3X38_031136 [Prunus dulcis]|uniref:Uncharacterized protein n=1 Tax=Prunus dulcis TaxID=3755 RepID=A0AAD4VBI9_PRUDU|nr:hypothetical protein L3X38_031136 [Prunus dulcis]
MGEAIFKLRTPLWCRSKALRCLSQLQVGSESGRFAQNFNVGLCAGRHGGDTVLGLGLAIGSFGRFWHLRSVSSFGREGVAALVLVALMLAGSWQGRDQELCCFLEKRFRHLVGLGSLRGFVVQELGHSVGLGISCAFPFLSHDPCHSARVIFSCGLFVNQAVGNEVELVALGLGKLKYSELRVAKAPHLSCGEKLLESEKGRKRFLARVGGCACGQGDFRRFFRGGANKATKNALDMSMNLKNTLSIASYARGGFEQPGITIKVHGYSRGFSFRGSGHSGWCPFGEEEHSYRSEVGPASDRLLCSTLCGLEVTHCG